MTRLLPGLLAVFLSGVLVSVVTSCGDDDDDDDRDYPKPDDHDDTGGQDDTGGDTDDTGGQDDTGDPSSFKPMAGHWVITGGDLVLDSCNVDTDDLPAGEGDGFDLTNRAEGAFSFVLDGSTDDIICALTDQDYICTPLTSSENIDDWDITIHSTLTVVGSFGDRSHSTSRYDIDIDCSGGDCDMAEFYYDMDFPCEVQIDALAQAQE